MNKKNCSNCKHRKKYSYEQPCHSCIQEGYGSHPLWEEEVDDE